MRLALLPQCTQARPTIHKMPERLQKILSQWGIASRRKAEDLILEGRVLVNGTPAQLGQKVDPSHDQIMLNG